MIFVKFDHLVASQLERWLAHPVQRSTGTSCYRLALWCLRVGLFSTTLLILYLGRMWELFTDETTVQQKVNMAAICVMVFCMVVYCLFHFGNTLRDKDRGSVYLRKGMNRPRPYQVSGSMVRFLYLLTPIMLTAFEVWRYGTDVLFYTLRSPTVWIGLVVWVLLAVGLYLTVCQPEPREPIVIRPKY